VLALGRRLMADLTDYASTFPNERCDHDFEVLDALVAVCKDCDEHRPVTADEWNSYLDDRDV